MQKGSKCCFEDIFKQHVPVMYEDSVRNRNFRYLIINWLKHKFIEVWIGEVVSHMKIQIQTSISLKETDLNDKRPIVINDNDVNRIFGWTLFKVRNKYKNLISRGCDDKFYYEKSKI